MSKKKSEKMEKLIKEVLERAQRGESSVFNPFTMKIEDGKNGKKS